MTPKKARFTEASGTSNGNTRKRGGASSNNSHGIVLKNARQRERYESLENRTIVPTRYPHFDNTLQILGIKDNVRMLLNNVGWLDFLEPPRSTYESLTLEFLSSLRLWEERNNDVNPFRKLSFRIFSVDYEMSLTEFAGILGLTNEGLVHDSRNLTLRPEGFNPRAFWNRITGEGHYEARSAKASSIHNPVLRYIHRVMACSIFGRGEMGGVRSAELFMLWAMMNEHTVNTCYYLVNHLASVADHDKGLTVVGGLVTFIVEKLGMEDKLEGMEKVEGNNYIDLELCKNMQMLEQVTRGSRQRYYLLISRQRSIQLPNPDRTDTRNPDNWLFTAEVNQPAEPMPEEEEEAAEQRVQNDQNFKLQDWCARIESEQTRQGAVLQIIREEQLHQGQQMGHMIVMLQALMRHFNIHQAPPPGQQ